MQIIENITRYSSFRLKCTILLLLLFVLTVFLLKVKLKDNYTRFFQLLLSGLVVLVFCGGVTGIAVKYCSKYIEAEEKYMNLVKRDILSIVPGIVCWGDSLTAGAYSDFEPYPSLLSNLLVENYTGKCIDDVVIPVVNMGVGGENSINIVGRSGNIPFALEPFQIEAEVTPVARRERSGDWG